ncbi:MAG: sigma-70 family RNA polymerase sigma factor [Chloroflexota bacterium]|nr:sigma-70 family RNA polymerase sigma factor [Chloroflexota bacterium]MDQ5864772.1 sigma-70 family RNA polymerase sigma factor [Chloroflexota bacterium]
MLNLSPTADDQLVSRIAGGDAAALEALYDRYVRQCFGLALRMVKEPALAEEVVQEVFLKLWSRPDSYSSQKGAFVSWLLSLVHHRCVDELRKRSRTEVALDNEQPLSVINTKPDPQPDPSEQVWVMEQQRVVRQALVQLPENQRQVLELAYFGGLSQSQIAESLSQPLGTVKTRMRMGLQNLRQLLESHKILRD